MTTAPRAWVLPPALVVGMAAATGVWVLWFVTHLPYLRLPEHLTMPVIVAAWFACFVAAGWNLARRDAWKAGALAGLFSALVGLPVIGSKLRPQMVEGGPADPNVIPAAPAMVLGFVLAGVTLGLVGTFVGSRLRRGDARGSEGVDWLHRFAWVTCATAAPLLFVGGLVTSVDAGMAVPDWPGTYGSNMFLYPLGPRVPAGIYLEHAHRLFGTLLGMAAIVLVIWAWCSRHSTFVKVWATGLLLFIILQGVLGGGRVLADSRMMAAFHGVAAQVIFAGLVALAVFVSPAYPTLLGAGGGGSKRLRIFATAALHTTFIQLVFGAIYRQLRHSHVLWTHAAFAMVVLVLAIIAGFAAMAFLRDAEEPRPGRGIRRAGGLLVGVVFVQFVLGWAAFMVTSGQSLDTTSIPAALVRTAHQANGALLVGVAAYLVVMARQVTRAK